MVPVLSVDELLGSGSVANAEELPVGGLCVPMEMDIPAAARMRTTMRARAIVYPLAVPRETLKLPLRPLILH